jgi:TolA-binding protein
MICPTKNHIQFLARTTIVFFLLFSVWEVFAQVLPVVPQGAQAISLTGRVLRSSAPDQKTLDKLAAARQEFEKDPHNADKIIWYGRRTAYAGDYRRAIEIFTLGIERFPTDARMLRHRGHRYISIREFDRAIADLEQGATLIEGQENEVEPDGLPNALNIPISSLHGNIWYHLGLAYYLKHDWVNARRAYQAGFDASRNDDNRVSTTHWLYMILRRMGDEDAAARALDAISADMNVIENTVYHRLCLFYKGEISLEAMREENEESPSGAAGAYGVANWYFYNGDVDQATVLLRALLATDSWPSFGYIAAEADLSSGVGAKADG